MSQEAMWMWGGVIVAVIAAAGVVWSLGWDWWKVRGLRRAGKLRRCRKCFFDMTGVPGLVCPECGKKWKSEKALRKVRRRWGVAVLGVVMLLAAGPVGATPRILSMRENPVRQMPTWLIVAIEPIAEALDTSVPWSPSRSREIEFEFHYRYNQGVVTPACEYVAAVSRVIASLVHWWNTLRGHEPVATLWIDARPFAPEASWKVYEDPIVKKPNRGVAAAVGARTLEERSRIAQAYRYSLVAQAMRSVIDPISFAECRLDLSDQEFCLRGEPKFMSGVSKVARELKAALRAREAGGESVGISPGCLLEKDFIKAYAWAPSDCPELEESFRAFARRWNIRLSKLEIQRNLKVAVICCDGGKGTKMELELARLVDEPITKGGR